MLPQDRTTLRCGQQSANVCDVQVSFGPISWLMVGEIFPLAVRGPAIALATLTNFGTNFVVSMPSILSSYRSLLFTVVTTKKGLPSL